MALPMPVNSALSITAFVASLPDLLQSGPILNISEGKVLVKIKKKTSTRLVHEVTT
jgi:hypothetical protein